jgi:hypothetical protein
MARTTTKSVRSPQKSARQLSLVADGQPARALPALAHEWLTREFASPGELFGQ